MKASLNTTIRILAALALLIVLTACPTIGPTTGTLIITITDDGSVIIAGARILLFDGTSGEVIDVLTTLATGQVEVELDPGSYQVKISAPGYLPTPPAGIAPIPLQIAAGQDLTETITLFADPNAGSTGSITGTVMAAGATGLAGVLVVAQNGPVWRATTTTIDGTFVLYNIPAGTTTIQGWRGGYNIPTADVVVTADTTSNQDLNAAAAPAGQVTGKVSFTSTSGSVIDITLLHPGTREVIPGLRTLINAGDFTYQLSGVPDGTFEIIASLDNDTFVIDPDESVQQGIPTVTIAGGSVVKDFKVTGAIRLDEPARTSAAVPIVSETPTFAWSKRSSYANASEFAIEVVDASGNVIWGGFGPANEILVSVANAGESSWSIEFDSDSSATQALESGRYYQVRIYAAKDDNNDPRGYLLVSGTETLDGLFRVQ